MPEVSVIIPNYNHAVFLQQRIDTVLKQTYQDFEVIILDDCSTDNSKEVIEAYRNHPKVAVIVYNETNSGSTFKQWEKGLALSTGKYIWIAESDDWCEVSLLETLMNAFEKNDQQVLGYVQSFYLLEGDRIKWIPQKETLEQTVIGKDFTRKYMLHGNDVFNASMAVFKKSAYQNIEGRYSKFKMCGDWLFWSDISIKGDVFISGKLLNYFRKHNADVSSKVYGSGDNYVEELHVLFSFYEDKLISEEDLFAELNIKYHRYKKEEERFSSAAQQKILELFYDHAYTAPLKNKLIAAYEDTLRLQQKGSLKKTVKQFLKLK